MTINDKAVRLLLIMSAWSACVVTNDSHATRCSDPTVQSAAFAKAKHAVYEVGLLNRSITTSFTNIQRTSVTPVSHLGIVREIETCEGDVLLRIGDRTEAFPGRLKFTIHSDSTDPDVDISRVSRVGDALVSRRSEEARSGLERTGHQLCSDLRNLEAARIALLSEMRSLYSGISPTIAARQPVMRDFIPGSRKFPTYAQCVADISLSINGKTELLTRGLMYYIDLDAPSHPKLGTVSNDAPFAPVVVRRFDEAVRQKAIAKLPPVKGREYVLN